MLALAGPVTPESAARTPVEFEVLAAEGSSTTTTTANQPAATGQQQYTGGAQASWRLSVRSRGTVVALGGSAPFDLVFTGEEHGSWMECELGTCSPMSCTMAQGPRAVAGLSLTQSHGDVVATLTILIPVGCGVPSDEGLVLADLNRTGLAQRYHAGHFKASARHRVIVEFKTRSDNVGATSRETDGVTHYTVGGYVELRRCASVCA